MGCLEGVGCFVYVRHGSSSAEKWTSVSPCLPALLAEVRVLVVAPGHLPPALHGLRGGTVV